LAGKSPAEEAAKNGRKDIADELLHEVKRVKAMRIQHTKPLQLKVQQQEKMLKEQSYMIEKQQDQIKKCNMEIEELKKMVLSLLSKQ
jgi:TolA-binding protein